MRDERSLGFFEFEDPKCRDVLLASSRLVFVTNTGLAYCVGENAYGECGASRWGFLREEPYQEPRYTVAKSLLSKSPARALALGGWHDCRIDLDDIVRCWGRNDEQQLGSTDRAGGPLPRSIFGLSGATMLALGASHSCALLMNGHVVCWGGNYNRQLGREGITNSAVPLDIPGVDNVVDLATGNDSLCAVRKDGAVFCWGNQKPPHVVPGLPPMAEVAIGADHACARSTAGDVFCWGKNDHMQLGSKIGGAAVIPVQVHWQ